MLTRSRSAPGSSPSVISTTVTLRAERGVDGPELETDVAAADDEQRLRDVGQFERAGRVHQPRAVDGQAGNVAGRDPVAMIACSKSASPCRPTCPSRVISSVRASRKPAVPWM